MESFYGGRQGASFVIKGAFKYITSERKSNGEYVDPYYGQAIAEANGNEDTIAEINKHTMIEQFKLTDFKDIWYGEYCIIDPVNKNNKNNGKIFRRTLKGAGDEDLDGSYAEYIGQIVGPAGPTPHLREILDTTAIEEKFDNLELNFDDTVEYISGTNHLNDFRYSREEPDDLYVTKFGVDNHKGIQLIPGNATKEINPGKQPLSKAQQEHYFKKDSETYPYIQNGGFNWYNVRINTPDKDISEIYVGFDIPYYVTDIESGDVLPDIGKVETIRQVNTVEYPFGNAPFYERYKINIPRGLRGGWFEDFRIVKRTNDVNYYKPNAIQYNLPIYKPLEEGQKDNENYPQSNHYQEDGFSIASDIEPTLEEWPSGAAGWIGTFYWRTATKQNIEGFQEVKIINGVKSITDEPSILHKIDNIFFGLHREIKNINFSDTGTLTFEYNSWNTNESQNAPNDDISAGAAGVRVNGENLDYIPQFETWIKKIDWITKIENDRIPSITYGDEEPNITNLANDNAEIVQGDNLKITFNNETVDGANTDDNTAYTQNLRTIADIKTFDDGSLRIYRSDGSKNSFGKRINWINGIATDSNNTTGTTINPKNDTLTIHFNNNNFGLINDQIEKNLRLITGMNLTEDGIFEITQSDGTGRTSTGNSVMNGITRDIISNKITDLGAQLSWIKKIYRTNYTDKLDITDDNGNIIDFKLAPNHLLIQFNNRSSELLNRMAELEIPERYLNNNGTNNKWFDFGVVQNTLDGLYVYPDPRSYTFYVGDHGDYPLITDRYDWLISMLNADTVLTENVENRVIVIQLRTIDNTVNPQKRITEELICYYASESEPPSWAIMQKVQIAPATIGIEDNITINEISGGGIFLNTESMDEYNNALDEPWSA